MIKTLIYMALIFSNMALSDSLYEFESINDEKRFYSLIKEIRCPKCTSGSLASSNAPVSEDLKQKIIDLIKEGKSDKEIKDFIAQRFGSEVLYNPGFNESTYFLWSAPALFLLLGLLIFFFRRKST
jgi:cytochrome c-type biogenesis protein CcmH